MIDCQKSVVYNLDVALCVLNFVDQVTYFETMVHCVWTLPGLGKFGANTTLFVILQSHKLSLKRNILSVVIIVTFLSITCFDHFFTCKGLDFPQGFLYVLYI